jgi:cytochrome d ubiquinol oxidase subunit II
MKTEGPVAQHARKIGVTLLLALLGFILLVSIWTPLRIPRIAERWFKFPDFYLLSPVPLATLLLAWSCWRGIRHGKIIQPFASAVGLFLLAYAGLVISNVPYLVPPAITIWQAAADPSSQVFMLIGTVFLLPLIFGYTIMVFWLVRGRVRPGEEYHH